jgi:DNA-binding NarL/FixJ family response regulator
VAKPEVSRTSSAPAPVGRRAAAESLTTREVEVLDLVARGQSNDAIAAELIVSRRTVERHPSNVYDKLGVVGRSARAAAVAHGMRGGLLRR